MESGFYGLITKNMRDIPREIADDYQEFFNFLNQEHNLTLTISEMDEIVFEAQKLVKKLTIPDVVVRSEQLVCDYCKGMGRKYVGVTLGNIKCPKCGKH